MEADMKIYCDYLNKQDIRLGDKQFKDVHIYRNFTDYDGTGKLEYGGRGGGYWSQVWKKERPKITINGKKTSSKDLIILLLNITGSINTLLVNTLMVMPMSFMLVSKTTRYPEALPKDWLCMLSTSKNLLLLRD